MCSHLILAHADEVLQGQLLVSHGVVGICIEHNERKRQQVGAVCSLEHIRVVFAEALCKLLHDAVNLLSFTYSQAVSAVGALLA